MQQLAPLENPDQFENLISDLFNNLYSTTDFIKFGKKGNLQKGIDIHSIEKNIVIKCKKKDLTRSKISLKKEILNEIESEVESTQSKSLSIKFDKYYFVSTFDDNTDFTEYCEELKVIKKYDFEIIYWGWQTLTDKILMYPNILKKYWSNFMIENQNIHQNIADFELRKKMLVDFFPWNDFEEKNRKKRSRMIIRMYDRTQYPHKNEIDNTIKNFTWFASGFRKIVFDGIEFILSVKEIFINENNEWDDSESEEFYKSDKVYEIGKILFKDLKNYDMNGDEYYNCPHFLCDFRYNGTPFAKIYYESIEKSYFIYEK